MDPSEWAMACGFSRATFAMRWRFLAAEVRSKRMFGLGPRRVCMRQMQLDRWLACHSLCLNLRRLAKDVNFDATQIEALNSASEALPLLHCLHLIGRAQVTLTESSIESTLLRLLARHALVLTLQVKTVNMPLGFLPNLQHLVLNLDAAPSTQGNTQNHGLLFPAISTLKGLRTLYLQFAQDTLGLWPGTINLTACAHLQHVALPNTRSFGSLILPAGCRLHAFYDVFCLWTQSPHVCHLVTSLSARHTSPWKIDGHSDWQLSNLPHMENLKVLRLTLRKEAFDEDYREWGKLQLDISQGVLPSLEVLELDVHCNLEAVIGCSLRLERLVIVAAGTLQLTKFPYPWSPLTSLKHIYLQSGAVLQPVPEKHLKIFLASVPSCSRARLSQILREEEDTWTVAVGMPAGFQPSDLQKCCCNACPKCLVRAGVPIPWYQAWTNDGNEKHFRPHYNTRR